MTEKVLRMKSTELPVLLELEATNGHIDYLEIRPSKNGIGAFINRVSKPIRKLIARNR
jgi:hypothetical protein